MMNDQELRALMQGIAPRFAEEAIARAAGTAAKPRSLKKIALCFGALACALVIAAGTLFWNRTLELTTGLTEPEVQHLSAYNAAMQLYFSIKNDTLCTVDFTGCGQDMDIEWQYTDWKKKHAQSPALCAGRRSVPALLLFGRKGYSSERRAPRKCLFICA